VEFAGGALRCGEYVTVRKVGDATQKVNASSEHLLNFIFSLENDFSNTVAAIYSVF